MNTLVADLLRARLRTAGADPLITYYDAPSGERVELSAATFANWVAKTANLLSWEVSVATGDPVALPLARTHPGHWMTAVWEVAIWQVGAYVDLSPEAIVAGVCVCGPNWRPHVTSTADVLACSLHPFATGLNSALPSSVTDADLAVRAQPDSYTPAPVPPPAVAWVDAELRLSQADLTDGPATAARRLVVPTEPWPTARDGIVAALSGGGSVVVVVDGSADDLSRIRSAERVGER